MIRNVLKPVYVSGLKYRIAFSVNLTTVSSFGVSATFSTLFSITVCGADYSQILWPIFTFLHTYSVHCGPPYRRLLGYVAVLPPLKRSMYLLRSAVGGRYFCTGSGVSRCLSWKGGWDASSSVASNLFTARQLGTIATSVLFTVLWWWLIKISPVTVKDREGRHERRTRKTSSLGTTDKYIVSSSITSLTGPNQWTAREMNWNKNDEWRSKARRFKFSFYLKWIV